MKIRILKISLIVLLFVSLCFFSTTLSINALESQVDYVDSTLKSEYKLNDDFVIPKAKISYGTDEKDAQAKLYLPNGELYNGNSLKFDTCGQYTLVYFAEFDSGIQTVTKLFNVNMPIASVENVNSSVSVGEYSCIVDEKINGLNVSLAPGDKVTINKVINLKNLTKNDTLIKFYPDAEISGVADYTSIIITLTDTVDSSKYIKIRLRDAGYNNGYALYKVLLSGSNYVSATYNNNNRGQDSISSEDRYGVPVVFDFTAKLQFYNKNLTMKDDFACINYDNATKSIFATQSRESSYFLNKSKQGLIANLSSTDYVADPFEGFSNDEAIMTIQADCYTGGNPAKIFISEIAGVDLTKDCFSDEDNPIITVDYAYDELPYAVVGKQYKVLQGNFYDSQSSLKETSTKVYLEGNSDNCLSMFNNIVTPMVAGNYIVEYKAVDYFGNETIIYNNFKCLDKSVDINFVIDKDETTKTTAKVGEVVTIPNAVVTGGSGNLTIEKTALLLGSKDAIAINDNKFIPLKAGSYYIQYSTIDYIGEAESDGYIVNVTLDDGYVFDEDAQLPNALISGVKYTLPELIGKKYDTNGNFETKSANIRVTDANGTKEISGFGFIPQVNSDGDSVMIEYYIDNNNVSYSINCYKAYESVSGKNTYYKDKYFVGGNITSVASDNCVTISTTTNNAEFQFINSQLAEGVSVVLDVNKAKIKFTTLSVYLTDSLNCNQIVKIDLKKELNGTSFNQLSINNGLEYSTNSNEICFFNSTCVLSNKIKLNLTIDKTLDGKEFSGFSSGKVYLKFVFGGVQGESAINISSISGCIMNNATDFTYRPMFYLYGEYKINCEIGSNVVIPKIIVGSILLPTVSSKVTVKFKGNYVVDNNGLTLNNVDSQKAYYILANEYGTYQVDCVAEDTAGNSSSYCFFINILDRVKPTLTVESNIPDEVTVGSIIKVPTAKAEDNYYQDVTIKYFYAKPNGDLVLLKDEKEFTVDKVGKYKIVIIAFDKLGNMTRYESSFNVKGE